MSLSGRMWIVWAHYQVFICDEFEMTDIGTEKSIHIDRIFDHAEVSGITIKIIW
jgi:hypothetical protein